MTFPKLPNTIQKKLEYNCTSFSKKKIHGDLIQSFIPYNILGVSFHYNVLLLPLLKNDGRKNINS